MAESSTSLIPVHADYRIEHGHLLAGEVDVPYDAYAYEETVTDFAKVYAGDREGTLAFARSWGLLGWAAVTDAPPDSREPLWWIWAHAANVRLALDLYLYLYQEDEEGLRLYLDGYRAAGAKARSGAYLVPAIVGREMMTIQASGSPAKAARKVISEIANRNGEALPDPVVYLHDGEEKERPVPCLLSLIYHHLARTVLDRATVRPCRECGSVIIGGDRRQSFCPAPPLWTGRDESRCAVRARQRRQRERRRA